MGAPEWNLRWLFLSVSLVATKDSSITLCAVEWKPWLRRSSVRKYNIVAVIFTCEWKQEQMQVLRFGNELLNLCKKGTKIGIAICVNGVQLLKFFKLKPIFVNFLWLWQLLPHVSQWNSVKHSIALSWVASLLCTFMSALVHVHEMQNIALLWY